MASKERKERPSAHPSLHRELFGVLWSGLSLLSLLSLLSFDKKDLPLSTSTPNDPILNSIGPLGAFWAGGLFWIFGMAAYAVPIIFLAASTAFFLNHPVRWMRKVFWALCFLICLSCLFHLYDTPENAWCRYVNATSIGGFMGVLVDDYVLVVYLGRIGAGIILGCWFVASMIFLFELHPVRLTVDAWHWAWTWRERREQKKLEEAGLLGEIELKKRQIGKQLSALEKELNKRGKLPSTDPVPAPPPKVIDTSTAPSASAAAASREVTPPSQPARPTPEPEPAPVKEPELEPGKTSKPSPSRSRVRSFVEPMARPAKIPDAKAYENYQLPPLDLLQPNPGRLVSTTSEEDLRSMSELIVTTLQQFEVQVTGGDITKGATIIRFEVKPAPGVRVDRIVNLRRDLARTLRAVQINILAPIPGKDTVGIEIPNPEKAPVVLRDLLDTEVWQKTAGRIPLAIGRDVYGQTVFGDLADMPHLLIAGTTGSGKSILVNCMLVGLLYRFSPEHLKLLLVDPKKVELDPFQTIPHLMAPVITDSKKVLKVLHQVLREMDRRYTIFSRTGTKNILSFNKRAKAPPKKKSTAEMEAEEVDLPGLSKASEPLEIPDQLPYIVVVIDELADLMLTTPADVENAIARLAQMGRAAGIHLVIITQTPRRDVITGVIKANIPSRIALQVASALDSRVILDESGAENLLGKGDLLYLPPASPKVSRCQGAFVDEAEVKAVVEFISKQAQPVFDEQIFPSSDPANEPPEGIEDKDLDTLRDCFEIMQQDKSASASLFQRRLGLGYPRAVRMLDIFEKLSIVGPRDPDNPAKPREIIVDLEDPPSWLVTR